MKGEAMRHSPKLWIKLLERRRWQLTGTEYRAGKEVIDELIKWRVSTGFRLVVMVVTFAIIIRLLEISYPFALLFYIPAVLRAVVESLLPHVHMKGFLESYSHTPHADLYNFFVQNADVLKFQNTLMRWNERAKNMRGLERKEACLSIVCERIELERRLSGNLKINLLMTAFLAFTGIAVLYWQGTIAPKWALCFAVPFVHRRILRWYTNRRFNAYVNGDRLRQAVYTELEKL